ncbi:MAG: branched-chain amino acid ABC transporter permease [Defluviitaleaceae bacterium]|nr:branched-chain amino acid ABC transporter permease [Defluviitaleaceae bacterium]
MLFLSQLINALQLGSIYALVALGYSMVYSIIKLLNFAHGDIIMVGGYIALFTLTSGLHPVFAIVFAIIGCIALSMLIERLAYRPLRQAPRISILITAIGISLLLQNLAQYFFSASGRSFPSHLILPPGAVSLGALSISYITIVTITVSVISMVGLTFLVQKTKLGRAMRAVSEDMEAASLMGVNNNHVISFTFAVGAALAGIGAILFATRYPLVTPTMGVLLGLKAFIAAVLGGIGSIPGAVLGGFAVAFAEVLVTAIGLSSWADGVVFFILILVLLFKPTGFMGKNLMEKV